jgi:hypothetical protein
MRQILPSESSSSSAAIFMVVWVRLRRSRRYRPSWRRGTVEPVMFSFKGLPFTENEMKSAVKIEAFAHTI